MKTAIAVIAALCLVQVLQARVTRDTDAQDANPLQDLLTALTNTYNRLADSIREHAPSNEEFRNAVKQRAQEASERLSEVAQNIHTQAQELGGTAREHIDSIASSINAQVAQLRQQHPEASQNVDQLVQQWQQLQQNVTQQVQLAHESLKDDSDSAKRSMETIGQTVVSQLQQLGAHIQEQIQRATNTQDNN